MDGLAGAPNGLPRWNHRCRCSSLRRYEKRDQRARLDEAHERLRILSEQLRLVGNQRVQIAARVVQYHAYAVRVQGEENRDPREENRPEEPPVARLNDALQEFYRSVRQQLRAADPEGVIHSDNLEEIAKGLKPLTWRQRSTVA